MKLVLTILHIEYDVFPVVRACYIMCVCVCVCVCVFALVLLSLSVTHDLMSSPHQRIL